MDVKAIIALEMICLGLWPLVYRYYYRRKKLRRVEGKIVGSQVAWRENFRGGYWGLYRKVVEIERPPELKGQKYLSLEVDLFLFFAPPKQKKKPTQGWILSCGYMTCNNLWTMEKLALILFFIAGYPYWH